MDVPILEPAVTRWECGHCSYTDTTRVAEPHSRFHHCAGLGITAPMVREGSGARTVANDREDYVGKEVVQTNDNGRPVMSITTEYPDGHTDLVVLAPIATTRSAA